MRRSALALSLLALAFPTTALAQSAGDNQYQDPFANQGTSQGSSNSSSSGSQTSQTQSSTSSGTAQSTSDPSGTAGTTASGTSTGTSASSGQLPFTGYDDVFTGVIGAVLLLGGVTARASVRDRKR